MYYRIDYGCRDDDPLQRDLNYLYEYEHDISTKIGHRGRINLFVSLLDQLIQQNIITSFDSAIDIGCNGGIYSRIISDFGFRHVLGVDIVDEYIAKATEFFGTRKEDRLVEFRVLNAEDLDESVGRFDFLLCTEVIEHTEHPDQVIAAFPRILRPGGVAVVSFPNGISPPYALSFLGYKLRGREVPRVLMDHLSYPSFRALRLMRETNLRLIGTGGTNFLPGFILRSLYRTRAFPAINEINASLSRLWPLKYLSQFFFVVLKNEGPLRN